MNFKRAFFAASAAMMLPGLAMAATFQTTVTIAPDTGDSVTVNYTCNAGDNLSDSFSLADGESVTFTNNIPDAVTADCSVTAAGAPAGYENIAPACTYTGVVNADANTCLFAFVPAGFEFEVEYEVDEAAEATEGSAYSDKFDLHRNMFLALEAFRQSDAMRSMLGDEFVDLYCGVKDDEYREFQEIVTPYEREILMFNV